MKKTTKNNKKKCRLFRRLKLFILKLIALSLFLVGIIIALLKLMELLRAKKLDKRNAEGSIKQYNKVLGLLDIKPEGFIEGIVVSNVVGCANIDLTKCELKNNAFISLTCMASAINIIVPEGFNVRFDGLTNATALSNMVSDVEDNKILYVAAKSTASAINIKRNGKN